MVENRRPRSKRVVVYDAEGYFVAPGIAELLALEGYEVELVTCLDQVAPVCDETLEGPLLRKRLHDRGVALRRGVTITGIEEHRVTGFDEFDEPVELETSAIVLVTQRLSDDGLYRELAADPDGLARWGIVGLYRIGDCVAPRILADAIFDGHRLGREIDSPAPATPLPYRRERAAIGKPGFSS
jgi:dimethylamine/trimethylamine dehydrogenase